MDITDIQWTSSTRSELIPVTFFLILISSASCRSAVSRHAVPKTEPSRTLAHVPSGRSSRETNQE